MATYLITRTEVSPVDVYLSQGRELAQLQEAIRSEGLFNGRHGEIWELKPNFIQHINGMGLMTLNKVGSSIAHTAAEMYLRKALYYARIDGHRDETVTLENFRAIINNNLADANKRKEQHSATPPLPTGN